jgi:cell division septation protein DedD
MADIDYDGDGGFLWLGAGQAQRMAQIFGGFCSLALVLGLCIWGYRLAMRDVTGVPVIRATEGAMRVAPDNPGGSVADHQGMAINAIAAIGNTQSLPDEILLAPAPAELDPEDIAGLSGLSGAVAAVANAPLPPGPTPLGATAFAPIAVSLTPTPLGNLSASEPAAPGRDAGQDSTADAVAMALAEALSLDLDPIAAVLADVDQHTTAEPGLTRMMMRPQRRPTTDDDGGGTLAIATSPGMTPELDPAALTPGTRLVQLGAFDSADIARGEWAALRARFGDLMSGKSLVIEAAQSGGSTFYRLRAHGFAGQDDVRRFCAALVAEGAACIPATVR